MLRRTKWCSAWKSSRLFLAGAPHAVVGASRDRTKIGNGVLQSYLQSGRPVYPLNPGAEEIEGLVAYGALAFASDLRSWGVGDYAAQRGGVDCGTGRYARGEAHLVSAREPNRNERSQERWIGMNVIYGGPCILVVLGYSERRTRMTAAAAVAAPSLPNPAVQTEVDPWC